MLRTMLTLSGTWMHVQHVEACPDIGPICGADPQAPYQHDQNLYSNDLVLDAELGLLKHLALDVNFTLRQVTDRIRFLDLQGNPYKPPYPDQHHRNETLVGPTDPWVMLHAGTQWGNLVFSGRGGVAIPLGSTVPNPFVLGREGLPHEHIQFGNGTWDPVVGASIDYRFERFAISAWTLDRFTFGTNSYGYQAGDRLLFGLNASSSLTLTGWMFTLGVDLYRENAEHWNGVVELEGNLGRTDLIADATVAYAFARGWSASLSLKVPFYSAVVGEQATYPGIVMLGVATDFGLGRRP